MFNFKKKKQEAALAAILAGQDEPLRHLLDNGLNPNFERPFASYSRITPLMLAVECGNVTAVTLLLAHAADPNELVMFNNTLTSPVLAALHQCLKAPALEQDEREDIFFLLRSADGDVVGGTPKHSGDMSFANWDHAEVQLQVQTLDNTAVRRLNELEGLFAARQQRHEILNNISTSSLSKPRKM